MFLKSDIFSIGLIAASIPVYALEIEGLVPGELSQLIGEPAYVTSLTVTGGAICDSDFTFIAENMPWLESLNLQCRCEWVPDCAFLGMTNLKQVSLPPDLKVIGMGAFSGSGITSITLPEGVDSIADYAFRRCTALESVTIPESVHKLGKEIFANCTALHSIEFNANSSITTLPAGFAEGCRSLQNLNAEALTACTEINKYALAHCSSLSEISIPQSVDTISAGAMAYMTGLKNLNTENLGQIPKPGKEVWAGVNQPDVLMLTADNLADEFRAALQWQEFKIMSVSEFNTMTSLTHPCADNSLRINAVDLTLHVTTDSLKLGRIRVYTVDGAKIADVTSSSREVSIPLPAKRIYIVATDHGAQKIKL